MALALPGAPCLTPRVAAEPGHPKPASERRGLSAFGPIKHVVAGVLDVGYVDVGPPEAPPVILLHGWPYDIHSFADVVPRLVSAGRRVVVPYLRGFGATTFLSASQPRNAQQAAVALDVIALMDALGIRAAVIGGFDWGARTANIVAALWPERCRGMVAVSGYLIGNRDLNRRPLPPHDEHAWWYQYYFATERGAQGYQEFRREFTALMWRLASPRWSFDEATFARTAAAFDNPDHAAIVIHNYRWRLGLAPGEPQYDALEATLARAPAIAVPSITLQGDADGAPHPASRAYALRFTGPYQHRDIAGGIGHNLPQEAPRHFADAVLAVDQL
ncbi:hydrolase [Luteitalea sp. TBR-22]|uniref:alpha/beta fold hydrolase n=1 Tax=Luteitalea sp. TBR-22 TaxID=2802971 RepID=UPI001AFB4F2C|nr:alpha/beta hydrolase [Luteitalea sp. TBR-22]BCS32639.1 hydrolase [Luteitalea sp. TBR-22]